MAISITTDLVDINLSEATANYAVLGTFATSIAASVDTYVQSGATVGGRVSANSAWAHASLSATDLTINERHVYQWLKCISIPQLDTKENGGLGITISSDATPTLVGVSPSNGPSNSKTWYVGGNTDALAGWNCYVVDPQSTPSLTLGTPVVSAITRVGIRAKMVGAVGSGAVKPVNIVFDASRYGTGLGFQGDNGGVPGTFSDILSVAMDPINSWGILTSDSSIYFGAGKLNFGTTGQTSISSFKETGQLFVWRNFPVANTFYAWNVVGADSFGTTFQIGNFTSGLATDGCVIRGTGVLTSSTFSTWTLNVSTGTTCSFYGSQLSELYRGTLQSNTTIIGCAFKNFGQITTNDASIKSCTFQDVNINAPISSDYALEIRSMSGANNITGCTFINCNRAIRITATGTCTFNANLFNGNVYDVENASNGTITIDAVNGSNVSTYINVSGGTTIINNAKSLILTGLKANSEVRIYRVSDGVELAGIEDSTTSFTYNYNYAGDVLVDIVIHHLDYQYILLEDITLGANGSSVPIQQLTDRNYLNP